jgi:RNA polymerase sigma factor (sigma-70 family)
MDEPQDFASLVRRHQGAVCAVAYAVLRDRGRSEEVAQEAFLVAWQKLPGLDQPPTMPAWICGIARNLAANAARRRKETAMAENDGRDLRPAGSTAEWQCGWIEPADPHTPLDSLLDRERDQLAERALGELPAREREVITLYYRNEQSVAEVASALGISEPAARQGLHRGRERLKTALTAVETTLRATRPSPAFTAACIAALAGSLAGRASAATTTTTNTGGVKIGMWLGAAAIAVGIAATFVLATTTGSATAVADEPNAIAAPSPGANATSPLAVTETSMRLDPIQRSIMVASIRDALATDASSAAPTEPPPSAAPAPAPHHMTFDFVGMVLQGDEKPPASPPPPGPLRWKSHFNYAFRAAAPLIYECVTSVGHMSRPGDLRFSLHVVGDPSDGTIVDAVSLTPPPDTEPAALGIAIDNEAAECVRETLMSLELPAPAEPTDYDVYFSYTIHPV